MVMAIRASWHSIMSSKSWRSLSRNHRAGALNFPAFYLPADRTGVMHAHGDDDQRHDRQCADDRSRAVLHPTPTLSGLLADFLQQIIEVDRMVGPEGEGTAAVPEIGARIEETILGGSVHIERKVRSDRLSAVHVSPEGVEGRHCA